MIKYLIARCFDKIFYKLYIYRLFLTGRSFSFLSTLDRDQQDGLIAETLLKIDVTKKKVPKVSAIYRIKNAEVFLELAVYSIIPLVDEIIFIDNGSTDKTKILVEKIKKNLEGRVTCRIYNYEHSIALAGSNYQDNLKQPGNKSLAEFYNYCFSKGTSDYLIKADAHYIFTLKGIKKIQDKLIKSPDVIYYRGAEIFGKTLSVEPHCFKRTMDWRFVDEDRYEVLVLKGYKLEREFIFNNVFMHVKRIIYSKQDVSTNNTVKGLYK
jgi:glycosyltransferase involved in cell wall biosynthesis